MTGISLNTYKGVVHLLNFHNNTKKLGLFLRGTEVKTTPSKNKQKQKQNLPKAIQQVIVRDEIQTQGVYL